MNLRLTPVRLSSTAVLFAVCLSLTGCATTYTVQSLPSQYAAPRTSDYSTLNLAAWAQPIPGENEIRRGDRLELTLNSGTGLENADFNWTVAVDENGEATVPNVGRVQLAGLSRSEAEQTIVNESIAREIYLTPAVDLKLEQRQKNTVVVTGAVEVPGTVEFPESSLSLADVIVRAGGLTSMATGQITVNQALSTWDGDDRLTRVSHTEGTEGTGRSMRIDLNTTSAEQLAAIQIPPGSTIGVERSRPRTVHVIGVVRASQIELPPGRDVRLLDALALAGGPIYSDWISNRVDIIRRVPGKDETVRIRASIRKAKKDDKHNIVLTADDIVSVEENPATFTLSTLGGLAGLTNLARTTVP